MKNDAGIKARQQIIEKIKETNNILVTVSRDPSVDELSAALGLTTLLNKMGKHGTAIFSGEIPLAINFLSPEKLFENTADSLRDFIIALDKEKADHLRYKIEGDVVKIFITPYHATITSDDLNYSQGDYNVELVIALGVTNKEHLDTAISAHGQILHGADIMTLSFGENSSRLGSIDWQDTNASCLCEMIANMGEALKFDKPLLDKQIATALLTGIVAATERFSNIFTTSRVMTVAAQLMAAGADQQLIAAKLQEAHEINVLADNPKDMIVEEPEEIVKAEPQSIEEFQPEPVSDLPPGSLVVDHELDEQLSSEEELKQIQNRVIRREPIVNSISAPFLSRDTDIISQVSNPDITTELTMQDEVVEPPMSTLPPELEESQDQSQEQDTLGQTPVTDEPRQSSPQVVSEPSPDDASNTTIDLAEEDMRREIDEAQNKVILAHTYLGNTEPDPSSPINSSIKGVDREYPVDIFKNSPTPVVQSPIPDLPMPPEVPDFSTLPPQPQPQYAPSAQSFDQPASPYSAPVSNDPGQFRIPGQ